MALEVAPTTISSIETVTSAESGRSREASFKRTEKGLEVRVAVIELQRWFDCLASAGHVVTGVAGAPNQRFDYFRSLLKHVETLATLLLFWRSSSAGMFPWSVGGTGRGHGSIYGGRAHMASHPPVKT